MKKKSGGDYIDLLGGFIKKKCISGYMINGLKERAICLSMST